MGIVILAGVLLVLLPPPAAAKSFRHYCALSHMPVRTIAMDPTTGNHSVVRINDEANLYSQEGTVLYQGRECFCAHWLDDGRRYYCPLGSGDTCGVSMRDGRYVGCFDFSRATQFSRNVFPVLLVIFAIVVGALFTTKMGRNAIRYVLSFCCPVCNEREANLRLRREIARRNARRDLVAAEMRRLRREVGWVQGYILKTKTFDPSVTPSGETPEGTAHGLKSSEDHSAASDASANNDDNDEHLCTICLLGLEEGDRIGDLPCGHAFHVDCLKPWIRRRNACPLCQLENIASEDRRFEEEEPGQNEEEGGGAETPRGGSGGQTTGDSAQLIGDGRIGVLASRVMAALR